MAVELEDNYKSVHQKLEKNLEAVKNLRTFKQQTQSDGKDKCILCGERNQEKDKLCLVCYTKRHCVLDKKQDYPSTAKIAILDWLEGMDYNELKELKDDNSESFDEQWFFEYDKKNKEIKEKFENWLKNHEDILKERKKKKSYALLKFDIDNLGKNLSSLDKGKQKELSEKLGEFSQNVKNFIDNNRGKTIYAGGDDFLGFVNLAYLFEVLDEIYCDFENMGFDEIVENLTFSTSIVIAHYKTPLHKVLDYSRELLDEAKDHFDDKNGVGIMVMSSNAVLAKTVCRYEDLKLLKKMFDKNIGMRLYYKLKNTFSYLENMDYEDFLTQKEMIKLEIKRLLKREESDFDNLIYKKLSEFLDKQFIKNYTNNYLINFENFIGFLKSLEQMKKVIK
ncbi:Cas10/Cmr2 second palm domain-containing protein [Caminibacter sp.]